LGCIAFKDKKYKYVPLWALLPALKSRDAAKGYLANAEKFLGRPLTEKEKAYLEDAVRQGDRVEAWLKQLGYFEEGPRGQLLRKYGIWVETDREAEEILKEKEEDERRALEMEMHRKINRLTEILNKLESLQGGGGSSFILEKAEISNGKIALKIPLWEPCLKTKKVWVIIVPRKA